MDKQTRVGLVVDSVLNHHKFKVIFSLKKYCILFLIGFRDRFLENPEGWLDTFNFTTAMTVAFLLGLVASLSCCLIIHIINTFTYKGVLCAQASLCIYITVEVF